MIERNEFDSMIGKEACKGKSASQVNMFKKADIENQTEDKEKSPDVSLSELIRKIEQSGVTEQLANLASVLEVREKLGLHTSDRVKALDVNDLAKKINDLSLNQEISEKDIELIFQSINFELTSLFYGHDFKFSSSETSDTLNEAIVVFDALRENFKIFKDFTKNFENQKKMIKVEINDCFLSAETLSKQLRKTVSLPFFSLPVSELNKTIEESRSYYSKLSKQDNLMQKDVVRDFASRSEPFSAAKSDLVGDDSTKGLLNPDDPIEIKIENSSENQNEEQEDEENKPYPGFRISVRNKRIAEESALRPKFDGTVAEGTAEELSDFIAGMKDGTDKERYVGGKGSAESVLRMMKKGTIGNFKLIVAKDKEGKAVGIAILTDNTAANTIKSASVDTLVVHAEYHSQGIGSAILARVKSEYDRINLMASAKTQDPVLSHEYFQEKLEKFYKENGFIGAKAWDRNIISLDDKTEAGKWREINSGAPEIGINNRDVYVKEVVDRLFLSVLANEKMREKISPETVSLLEEWKKVHIEKKRILNERILAGKILDIKKRL